MMKNGGLLKGSSAGLAAVIHLDTTVGFLADRQQVIDLTPLKPENREGYVWKQVFLRKAAAGQRKGGPRA